MASCEHCWWDRDPFAHDPHQAYLDTLKAREADGTQCCEKDADGNLTLNARRLRAGDYWNEDTMTDERDHATRNRVATQGGKEP